MLFNSLTSIDCAGGDGSTDAYGFVLTILSFSVLLLEIHLIRSRAISHVSATSITGSLAYF